MSLDGTFRYFYLVALQTLPRRTSGPRDPLKSRLPLKTQTKFLNQMAFNDFHIAVHYTQTLLYYVHMLNYMLQTVILNIENNYCTVIVYYTPVSFYQISVPFVLGRPHQVTLVDQVVLFGQLNPAGTENCVFLDDSKNLKPSQASHISHYLGTM